MKATAIILGSGTSNGVPTLGKEYSKGFLANPKNHRTRSSCLLQGPVGNVLVDCAPEMRLQLIREEVYDIDSVIITHTHADHIMGMDDVRAFCLKYRRAMPVYASEACQEDIKRIFPYAFEDFPDGIWVPRFELKPIPEFIREGGLEIETLWVEHGPIPCLALRVGDFGYVTDVSFIPPAAWNRLAGLKTLILDAVRIAPHPNHFHYEKALEVGDKLGAQTTYFTHLSDDYDHDLSEKQLPSGMHFAYDGLKCEITL